MHAADLTFNCVARRNWGTISGSLGILTLLTRNTRDTRPPTGSTARALHRPVTMETGETSISPSSTKHCRKQQRHVSILWKRVKATKPHICRQYLLTCIDFCVEHLFFQKIYKRCADTHEALQEQQAHTPALSVCVRAERWTTVHRQPRVKVLQVFCEFQIQELSQIHRRKNTRCLC